MTPCTHLAGIHSTLDAAEPLWKRVPTRDAAGHPVSDFMMLLPRLAEQHLHQRNHTLEAIYSVLRRYGRAVLFAEVNIKLNLLWVSVRPIPGICLELPAVIRHVVPDAKLIAHRAHR